MNQKICIIISKNLAEFEYLVPIIEKNNCNVDVFLFDYNIRNLIRTKSILEKYSKRNKIKIFDIQYFLRYRSKILGYISKQINTRSISIKSLIKTIFYTIMFNKKLKRKYLYRFLGLLSSMTGRPSDFRG